MDHPNPQRDRDSGRLLGDLYAYLGQVTFWVPPLRDRPEEIRILAHEFLVHACRSFGRAETLTFSAAALDHLVGQSWLGGIRELQGAVMNAVAGCEGDQILPEYVVESSVQRLAGRARDFLHNRLARWPNGSLTHA